MSGYGSGNEHFQWSLDTDGGSPTLIIFNVHPDVRVRVPLANLDLTEASISDEMVDAAREAFLKAPADGRFRSAMDAVTNAITPWRAAIIAALNARKVTK